jgi:hypothetical protein
MLGPGRPGSYTHKARIIVSHVSRLTCLMPYHIHGHMRMHMLQCNNYGRKVSATVVGQVKKLDKSATTTIQSITLHGLARTTVLFLTHMLHRNR